VSEIARFCQQSSFVITLPALRRCPSTSLEGSTMRELTEKEIQYVSGGSQTRLDPRREVGGGGGLSMGLATTWASGVAGLAAGSIVPGWGNLVGFGVGLTVGALANVGYYFATER
jgi:hypothetical protein